jgi:hypothetical protein
MARKIRISARDSRFHVRRTAGKTRGGPWVVGRGSPQFGFPTQQRAQADADRRRKKEEKRLNALAAAQEALDTGRVGRWGLVLPKNAAKRDKRRFEEPLLGTVGRMDGGEYTRPEVMRLLDRTGAGAFRAVLRLTERMLERQTDEERATWDARRQNAVGFDKPDSFTAEKLIREIRQSPSPRRQMEIHYELSSLLAKYSGRQLLEIMNRGARQSGWALRTNPARRNGLPGRSVTPTDKKNYCPSSVDSRMTKRSIEKRDRQRSRAIIKEEMVHGEALAHLPYEIEEEERLGAHLQPGWRPGLSMYPFAEKLAVLEAELAQEEQEARAARERAAQKARFRQGLTQDRQPPVLTAEGLHEIAEEEEPYRQPVTAAQLRKKYKELRALFQQGKIDEATYLRLRRSFRYGGKHHQSGVGDELARLEKKVRLRGPEERPWRASWSWVHNNYRNHIGKLLLSERLEAAKRHLLKFSRLRKEYRKKNRMDWEKAAWQRLSALKARSSRAPMPRLPDFTTDSYDPFTGVSHGAEIAGLYAGQVQDAQAPTVDREDVRQPDDPFADFMYHEGADAFFRENPRGAILEKSSDTYRQWLPYLKRGISPHNNPVKIVPVPPGWGGVVPDGVKAYYAGNVEADNPYYRIFPGGLVIVNEKPERKVYICP